MKLKRKQFNSKINIHYFSLFPEGLAKDIIDFLWLNKGKSSKFELIKEDKRNVYKLNYNDKIYYIKLYKDLRFSKRFKNLFRSLEGIRYYKIALNLLNSGLNTAEPILGLTYRQGIFNKQSAFVTEQLKGKTVCDYIVNTDPGIRQRKEVMVKLGKILAKLINNNFVHLDPSLYNFMINFGRTPKMALIDIDDIYIYPFVPRFVIYHMLARCQARSLADLYRRNSFLTGAERLLAVRTFAKNYKKELDLDVMIDKVNRLTVKRFLKRDYKKFVVNDPILNNIYRKMN